MIKIVKLFHLRSFIFDYLLNQIQITEDFEPISYGFMRLLTNDKYELAVEFEKIILGDDGL